MKTVLISFEPGNPTNYSDTKNRTYKKRSRSSDWEIMSAVFNVSNRLNDLVTLENVVSSLLSLYLENLSLVGTGKTIYYV